LYIDECIGQYNDIGLRGLPFYELMPEVAKAMTNVYYDTAASPLLYSKRIYAIASEIVGAGKILFGTDFPLISPKRYLEEIKEAGLGEEDQKKILGFNAARLLGSEKETP
jgi:predicted TIM-barrel fold metal-dependent hydrolase